MSDPAFANSDWEVDSSPPSADREELPLPVLCCTLHDPLRGPVVDPRRHKTATLTLDRYGHLFPDDLGRIADAFDAAAENTADWLRTGPGLRAVPCDGDRQ
jgi:hypothetical protein